MSLKQKLLLIRSIGLAQFFVNCAFWLFRKQRPAFPIHFTSTIIKPKNISYHSDFTTLKSMAVSSSCYFQANNGIRLGPRCLFAPGVKLISSNHDIGSVERKSMVTNEIIVGSDVWIGANAIILPGVCIADGVVIGAASVVTKSISMPGSVVAGNPARIIRSSGDNQEN